ncbi:MAG: ABC transporter substrate-binding protein [Anderseniella sp.]|nr:ABC transporter substrate-binding protein [Anderseniella sp.]
MRLKSMLLGTALAAAIAIPAIGEAYADSLYVPLLSYRTGPFAGSGVPISNGMADYLTMLNERDGGIGGVRIEIEECETGYNAEKGVECYEKTKGKGALVYNPYSTGITLQLIPKASVDKIPVLSMAYGLSAAAVGTKFPWIFNPPATYWDGASAIIKHIAEQEGGLENLKDKKIGYIYLDAGYGKEPIPLLEQFKEKYGFELFLYAVPGKEMQNQGSIWLNVQRDNPDYMVMWGWGAMNPTAVKEAANIGFDMKKFIGVWWSGGDDDARPAGDGAIGFRTLNFHGTGTGYPAIQDIMEKVVKAGKSQVSDESKVGENLYNRGVYNSVLIAEAIRTAQEKTGKKVINAEDMRIGLENLNITAERIKEIGLEGFMAPLKVTCEDHSGHHQVYVQEWDGKQWQKVSDWFDPMQDVVRPLLEQAADEYVKDKPGWETQTCS